MALVLLLPPLTLSTQQQARQLVDIVRTDASCYQSSEPMRVEYSIRMPSLQNWIALVLDHGDGAHGSNNENNTSTLVRSQWTCGSQDDQCPDRRGVTFQNLENLQPGNYFIHLKSYGYHGQVMELRSEHFEITDGSCQATDSVKVGTTRVGSTPQFTSDSTLVIKFTRRIPQKEHVIGIFPMTARNISVTPPLLWAWPCTSTDREIFRTCQLSSSGSISFTLETLPTGKYQAVLGTLTASTQLIIPLKLSEPFFVSDTVERATYRRLEELPCTEITVETSKSHYLQGESIPVSYHHHGCDDGAKENVAVYEASVDLSYYHGTRLASPRPSIRFCPSQESCADSDSKWPIPSGFYKAILIRILEQNHYYFESEEFEVVESRESNDQTTSTTRRYSLRPNKRAAVLQDEDSSNQLLG
jgi:hypothetical protein